MKWQDLDGNNVKGETQLDTLMLSGKVRNAGEVRDIYVHLNDKKVFYKANLNQQMNLEIKLIILDYSNLKHIINPVSWNK